MKFTRKWSARSVFYQMNREEVSTRAKLDSQLTPGHPKFLGALQRATTSLWTAVHPRDKEDYAQAAKEWSVQSPPKDVQSR
jgi:hypothetical protein